MAEIAVICASPPGINPGMDSVDDALVALGRKRGFLDRLRFFRLYPPAGGPEGSGSPKLIYADIGAAGDFFAPYDAVLYWGDFLHMRQYHQAVARRLVSDGACPTLDSAEQRARDVFLQARADEGTLSRTLTFGGSLLFNTLGDESDPSYRASLERFLGGCRRAWFRDVFSAHKACLIRGRFEPSCLGVDCATLTDADEAYPRETRPSMEDRVGVFFGRTPVGVDSMVDFAFALADAVRCRASWLAWGDQRAFPPLQRTFASVRARGLDGFREQPAAGGSDAVPELLRYRAIVTDTYHVCVNAWSLGVPAVCLLAGEPDVDRSVNSGDRRAPRDKRQVFMGMYDALDFAVPLEELSTSDDRARRLAHLAMLIDAGEAAQQIRGRIRSHAAAAERSLLQFLC